MTDDLDQSWRRAPARTRIQRITSGLEDEADVLADGALVPERPRLAPCEHWRPVVDAARAESERAQASRSGTPPTQATVPAAPRARAEQPTSKPRRRPWRQRLLGNRANTASWLDRLLVIIEVLAMLGLVGATFASLGVLDRLQQDLGRFSRPPVTRSPTPGGPSVTPAVLVPTVTPLPTPSARATHAGSAQAVLPGGRSTPPGAPGLPPLTATPLPTPASLAGARLVIPSIGVDAPIVEGDDWEALKRGVGHHVGSALPGETGNVVLAAHNDVYGAIFERLTDLEEGDAVRIETAAQTYHYVITDLRIVLPNATYVMDPTDEPTLTLITCYPPLVDSHRFVATAEFVR